MSDDVTAPDAATLAQHVTLLWIAARRLTLIDPDALEQHLQDDWVRPVTLLRTHAVQAGALPAPDERADGTPVAERIAVVLALLAETDVKMLTRDPDVQVATRRLARAALPAWRLAVKVQAEQ